MVLSYCIKKTDKYFNVKDVLKSYFKVSSRLIIALKKNGYIYLNGNATYLDSLVKPNDIVSFCLDFEENNSNILPNPTPINIVYEDDCMLIVNKPPFLAIHPSMSHFDNSLSNSVKNYFDSINLKKKIRIVNRLDKDTSGLVIFAKNQYVQEFLIKQMNNNTFEKYYIGILDGTLKTKHGTIDKPIARKEGSIIERCIDENGENALTHYKILKEKNNMSLTEFKLETGRTHQIRVHTMYLGTPILGDTLYGTNSSLINRQALHSYKIKFIHPVNRKEVEFTCDIPDDMKNILI